MTREEVGANTDSDKQIIYNTYTELLDEVAAAPGKSKTETYEDQAKKLFVEQPANMKLLVVVDKLLTGFDAPLDEVIKFRKERAAEYEQYLKKIAELAKQVQAGVADDAPDALKASAGLRAIYNNLKARPRAADGDDGAQSSGPVLALAMRIDAKVREVRPDDWRGHQAKEQVIKRGLYEVVADEGEVENLFRIIKAQGEY